MDNAGNLLFLSHAGADTDAARELARRIADSPVARDKGLRVWLDVHDLTPGQGWQRQIEDAIEHKSTAFAIYLASRGAVNWVEAELRVALARATKSSDYPLIPILGPGVSASELPPFARQYHGVRDPLSNGDELQKLIQVTLGYTVQRPVSLVHHPFVGLASFEEGQTDLFYGREKDIERLVGCLRNNNLVMVVGDSGSGKSSLVRAGLIPRFRGGAFADRSGDRPDTMLWHVITLRPLQHPFQSLADAIVDAATPLGLPPESKAHFRKEVSSRDATRIRDAIRDTTPQPSKTLLFVDQFEELWTLANKKDRGDFVTALLRLRDLARLDCRIVLAMRRDYYNLCAAEETKALYDLIEVPNGAAKIQVRRMDSSSLRAAITEPLRLTEAWDEHLAGLLADAVLEDVGDRAGDLALMQVALTEAWRHRQEHNGRLLDAYIARGRVTGAIANTAEEVFTEMLLPIASEDEVKAVFVRLVHFGETGGTTRRIASRSEFGNSVWKRIVQPLASEKLKRLLVISGEAKSATVELIHEALITQWVRYQTWLQEAASDKRIFDNLIEDARAWQEADEIETRLARGYDLQAFADLKERRAEWLSEREHQFVAASKLVAQREEAAQRAARAERDRLFRRTIRSRNIVFLVALLAMSLAAIAFLSYRAAQKNLFLAALTKAGRFLIDEEPAHALVLADVGAHDDILSRLSEKIGLIPNSDDKIRATTITKITQPAAETPLRTIGVGTAILAVSYSHDGKRFAVGDQSGRIAIGLTDGTKHLTQILGQTSAIRTIRFSPDDADIAAGFDDGSIRIWNTNTLSQSVLLCGHHGQVNEISYHPSGKFIASAADDGRVIVWTLPDGKQLKSLRYGDRALSRALSLTFSDDGRSLVASDEDGHLTFWSVGDWRTLGSLDTGHSDIISIAFNPTSFYIATASINGDIDIWERNTLRHVVAITAYRDKIWRVRFSPDGAVLAVAYWNGTVRFWSLDVLPASPRFAGTIDGNDSWINDLAFSPDAKYLLTACEDGIARLWDITTLVPVVFTILDNDRETLIGRYSNDGAWFVSGSRDRQARLYRVDQNGILRRSQCPTPVLHEGWVKALAISPHGRRVYSAGTIPEAKNNVIRVWYTENCTPLRDIEVGGPITSDLALSADGHYLAYASHYGEVKIIDADFNDKMTITGLNSEVRGLDFSPDDVKLAIGTSDKRIIIVTLDDGKPEAILRGHSEAVDVVRFSPDGRLIASAGETPDNHLLIWDAQNHRLIQRLVVQGGAGAPIFSLDGKTLAAGSDARFLSMWAVGDWKKTFELDAFAGVRGVFGFNPRTGDLAFDGGNGEIHVLPHALGKPAQKPVPNAFVQGTQISFDSGVVAEPPSSSRPFLQTCAP